ncbi:hypothetical protein X801_10440, partial [Opisthorchis viverrini]
TVTPSSEKRLIKQLINNYEKAGKIGRPVKNNKETVVVGLGLSLFQLLHLNEKNQILTINVWTKYIMMCDVNPRKSGDGDRLIKYRPG